MNVPARILAIEDHVPFRESLVQLLRCEPDFQDATSINTVPLTPKSMGQKIRETGEALPSRRGAGKTVIEAGIDHQIFPYWV